MNKIIIILVIFVMLFSGFTLLENSQTNNFYENKINTNNFISSNSPIYNLTIYIHNSPAGNGYYQQLFNFNSTSYFINNLNQNASNFYISYENGTLIYSWIQNWNFTTKNLTIWSKLQNGTKVIMIEIFNQNTNLLSATGYLGEAPQLSATWGEYNNYADVGLIYIPATTETMLLNGYTGNGPTFSLRGYLQSWANNQTTMWANDTLVSGDYPGWYGPYYHEPSGSFYTLFELKLTGTTSYITVDHIQDSFANSATFTYTNITGANQWKLYSLNGAINLTTSTEEYRGGIINGPAEFATMEFRGIYIAYYSGNPTNNSASPTIATMPTFTTSTQIMFTYHIQIKSFNNQNIIKNCFKYNNNVYNSITNTFIFSNSSKFIFSILPQNYTILNTSYLTNTSIINIKQNQYTSANFINYYYNISISYFSKTSTPINYYSPPNYYFTIGIIIFLLIGGLIIYTKIRNGD